jgi:citrate lyase subunit beta/citryl-CoA lyase
MSRLLFAARAAGLDAIDAPCFDLHQPDRLEAHTRFGADLGFDGKALIHPSQIEAANRHFTPSAEAIAEAERVLAAYERAAEAGSGALTLEGGQFIDAVHVEIARGVLRRAGLAGVHAGRP